MKIKNWYYTNDNDEGVNIEGLPTLEQIEEAYKCSCWDEPDSDLNCASCVVQFLLEKCRYKENILEASLRQCGLRKKTINTLARFRDIHTVGDLVKHTEEELLNTRDVASTTLAEIVEVLDRFNLTLKGFIKHR